MNKVQIIEHDGKPLLAVVPIDIWSRVKDMVEDLEDISDLERFDQNDDGVRIPLEVVQAQVNGAHPVRAWREYRKMTQDQLAQAAKISKAYLSQIETGKRAGQARILRALAAALDVPLDLLVQA